LWVEDHVTKILYVALEGAIITGLPESEMMMICIFRNNADAYTKRISGKHSGSRSKSVYSWNDCGTTVEESSNNK
jgi:hypothetical protein